MTTIQFTTSGDNIVAPFEKYFDSNNEPYCDKVMKDPFMFTYTIVGAVLTNDYGKGTIERISNDMIRLRSANPFSDLILQGKNKDFKLIFK